MIGTQKSGFGVKEQLKNKSIVFRGSQCQHSHHIMQCSIGQDTVFRTEKLAPQRQTNGGRVVTGVLKGMPH
jgi:hypothetical protein